MLFQNGHGWEPIPSTPIWKLVQFEVDNANVYPAVEMAFNDFDR
jgi:hypothetical protein